LPQKPPNRRGSNRYFALTRLYAAQATHCCNPSDSELPTWHIRSVFVRRTVAELWHVNVTQFSYFCLFFLKCIFWWLQPTAQGLHLHNASRNFILLHVERPFASGGFLRCMVGELGTPLSAPDPFNFDGHNQKWPGIRFRVSGWIRESAGSIIARSQTRPRPIWDSVAVGVSRPFRQVSWMKRGRSVTVWDRNANINAEPEESGKLIRNLSYMFIFYLYVRLSHIIKHCIVYIRTACITSMLPIST